MTQGYYSIIQYCPSRLRLEVCNLGVLLFCPELQYLDVEMAHQLNRIHDIFGKEHNLDYVRTFKNSIEKRIRQENFLSLEALEAFIESRANKFILTAPRNTIVKDTPDSEHKRD